MQMVCSRHNRSNSALLRYRPGFTRLPEGLVEANMEQCESQRVVSAGQLSTLSRLRTSVRIWAMYLLQTIVRNFVTPLRTERLVRLFGPMCATARIRADT